MTISEAIQQMIDAAPLPFSDQTAFSDGRDAGYKRGLESALAVAKVAEK